MKLRLFTVAIFCLLLMSCSKDEGTPIEEVNLITAKESAPNEQPPTRQRTICFSFSNCDENFVFPQSAFLGGDLYNITYPRSIPLEDIHCIRYEYFYCYEYLEMARVQPSDPRKETWTVQAKPDDDLDTTVCNDPRVQSSNCDDD